MYLEIEKEIEKNNQTENDTITFYCPETNLKLYRLVNGEEVYINEHGSCRACGQVFHVTALATKDMKQTKYPIRYQGYMCKDCDRRTI